MIYLDSAATCFHRPPEVLQAVTEAMNSFGNPSRAAADRLFRLPAWCFRPEKP